MNRERKQKKGKEYKANKAIHGIDIVVINSKCR